MGPLLAWLGVPIALGAALSLQPESRQAQVSEGFIAAWYALAVFYARILPVLLGAVALEVAARRRLRTYWPLVGAAVVDVLAGSLTVYSVPGELGINSALLPWLLPFSSGFGPKSALALGEGVLRAAFMLALSLIIQRLARRLGMLERPTLATD